MSCYKEGKEIISTEDMIARVEIMNDRNKGWSSTSYWGIWLWRTTDLVSYSRDARGIIWMKTHQKSAHVRVRWYS